MKRKQISRVLVISIITFLLCLTGLALKTEAKETTEKNKVKNSKGYPSAKLDFSVRTKRNQETGFYKFYYIDQNNLLNVFFWQYSLDPSLHYTSAWHYQEQPDGKVEESEITWDSDVLQVSSTTNRFSIQSQWMDEENGDFYFIVCSWTSHSDDNPNYLLGIHSDGELFLNKKLEDELITDKIDAKRYSCGLTIDYLGQEDGVAYFSYHDNSGYQVVYFDMAQQQFTKQISTDFIVRGIIDNQYVGIANSNLYVGSIPNGESVTNLNGMSILTGKSSAQKLETLNKKDIISINSDYVYRLTDKYYMQKKLGDKEWTVLANVSNIMGKLNDSLTLQDMMAKGKDSLALLFYEDNGEGYYVNSYKIK